MPWRHAFVLSIAVVLSGCGGSVVPGSVASGGTVPSSTPVAVNCPQPMKDFLLAIEDLDSRLGVGLNFQDYGTKVGDVKVVYDRIVPADLSGECATSVGTPAEAALNDYIAAYTTWNDCVGSTSCTQASITSQLQAKWADATEKINQAKNALAK